MRDLATLLTKHYGLHEGAYDLMLEFQIGIGAVGPDVDYLVPGAAIGVSRIGLMRNTGRSCCLTSVGANMCCLPHP